MFFIKRFFVPGWVKKHNLEYKSFDDVPADIIEDIKHRLKNFKPTNPDVSIVIPAYNEEKDILKTLSSLSSLKSSYKVEIIVANNNSKDRTQEILDKVEVISYFESKQGVQNARNKGLQNAKGTYVLNADSDTIYPETWVDAMVKVLKEPGVSSIYCNHSFIPSKDTNRFSLTFHELLSEFSLLLRTGEYKAINALGFKSGFKREEGLKVNGFDHPDHANEDGWMAYKLSKLGKIKHVGSEKARVWTSDRRLVIDGGLAKSFVKRLTRELKNLRRNFSYKIQK